MPLLRDLGYLAGPARRYRPAYRQLADWIALERGALLDIGCGPGWLCVELARSRPELDCVGIDHSERMVRAARANGAGVLNATFKRMSGEHIVYPSATFDVVVAVQAAHHWPQPAVVLGEAVRVLRPDGRLLLLEADPDAAVDPRWVARPLGWPPKGLVRRSWRRWHVPVESLQEPIHSLGLETRVEPVGFYRALVCSR